MYNVPIMSTLAGPFGNLHNFLHFIALPNCSELAELEQGEREEIEEKGRIADSTRREFSRALFNAVVSLDSVLDYAFQAEGGGTAQDQHAFNARLFEKEPGLNDLREVANAMKHCVTWNPQRMNGEAVVRTSIRGDVTVTADLEVTVDLQIESHIIDKAGTALPKAFRFWLSQGQRMNAFAPRIDLTIPTLEPDDGD